MAWMFAKIRLKIVKNSIGLSVLSFEISAACERSCLTDPFSCPRPHWGSLMHSTESLAITWLICGGQGDDGEIGNDEEGKKLGRVVPSQYL